jgi:hypothetical protein
MIKAADRMLSCRDGVKSKNLQGISQGGAAVFVMVRCLVA